MELLAKDIDYYSGISGPKKSPGGGKGEPKTRAFIMNAEEMSGYTIVDGQLRTDDADCADFNDSGNDSGSEAGFVKASMKAYGQVEIKVREYSACLSG